jgi:hypothetical protein
VGTRLAPTEPPPDQALEFPEITFPALEQLKIFIDVHTHTRYNVQPRSWSPRKIS